jgi:hypothetical protein
MYIDNRIIFVAGASQGPYRSRSNTCLDILFEPAVSQTR